MPLKEPMFNILKKLPQKMNEKKRVFVFGQIILKIFVFIYLYNKHPSFFKKSIDL